LGIEVVLRGLILKVGYQLIPDDGTLVKNGKIRGRGAWHQIDVYCLYKNPIAFVHPLRILCKAKFYKGDVGLP
jgi:hypothetical protein